MKRRRQPNTTSGSPLLTTGTFTLDQALDSGLLKNAIGYRPSGRPRSWYLTYEDGSVGRAVIVDCWGFELLTLGLEHRRRLAVQASESTHQPPMIVVPMTSRPARWRDAS